MNWFRKFMAGRYGMDYLSSTMVFIALILAMISNFTSLQIIYLGSFILMVLAYYRVFSRNINKRLLENRKFLQLVEPINKLFRRNFNRFKERKDYKYFKCNMCGQLVRVPKGKGRVSISCPKCNNKMIRKA